MRLHKILPLLSVSYQFHGCFNVCIFLPQIFFHIVSPSFPLSSSAPHAFDVAVECLVWESIIFHPLHVTEPCKSLILFRILSIIVYFCFNIFLIVSFLNFCSLETPSIFLSQPISIDTILLSSRFLRFQQLLRLLSYLLNKVVTQELLICTKSS